MRQGNWIPVDKNIVRLLPKNRPYSEPEAMISITYDYDEGNQVSESGYAKLWQWSRTKVRNFLSKYALTIESDKAQKKGHVKKHVEDMLLQKKAQVRFVDSKDREPEKNMLPEEKKHVEDMSKNTTIYPIKPKSFKKKNIKKKKSRMKPFPEDPMEWPLPENLIAWGEREGYNEIEMKLYAEAMFANAAKRNITEGDWSARVMNWVTSPYNTQDKIDAIRRRARMIQTNGQTGHIIVEDEE